MAKKEIPFYNLDGAVGPGCANKPTDVMLVQFFLRRIYSHPQKINKPPGKPLNITGTFDDTTAMWIRHFQNDIKTQGASILADGRVDPAKGDQLAVSSISKTRYTIGYLNYGHCARFRPDHNHLETHALVPGALKAELAMGEPSLG